MSTDGKNLTFQFTCTWTFRNILITFRSVVLWEKFFTQTLTQFKKEFNSSLEKAD